MHPSTKQALLNDTVLEVTSRYGLVEVCANDFYVGHAIHVYGEYSPFERDKLLELLKPGDWAIDGGAHQGWLSMVMAEAVGPTGKVITFEPQEFLRNIAQKNFARCGINNIDVHGEALSDKSGYVYMPNKDYRRLGNFGAAKTYEFVNEKDACAVIKQSSVDLSSQHSSSILKDIKVISSCTIDELNLPRLNLVKLDLEGGELKCLKGAINTLNRLKPVLIIEDDRQDQGMELRMFLGQLGYRWERFAEPLFRRDNFRQNPVNIYGPVKFQNLICFPKNIH